MNEENGAEPLSGSEQSSRERRVFGIVLILGVCAFGFGVLQLWNGIHRPFAGAKSSTNQQNQGSTSATIAALRQRDTDGDELSDYDELYVYQTSPYLADSDGDDGSDKDEIAAGTDPNCPKNRVCTPIALTANSSTNAANMNGATNSVSGATNTTVAAGSLSLADLRETLRNAGAPATTLDGMTDEELAALYKEVTGKDFTAAVTTNTATTTNTTTNTNGSSGNSNASANTNATNSVTPANTNAGTTTNQSSLSASDLTYLQNLTPAQIRDFLIQGGADQASINSMDDETLQAIFQQALTELGTTP